MRSLLVVLALTATASARPLPKHRPADFSASYSMNGGMGGGGEHAEIAAQGTFQRYPMGGQGGSKGDFTMSDDELDKLYAALRKAGADRVHVVKRKGRIYDAPSSSYSITAGGHTWNIGDDADHQIARKDLARFQATIDAMQASISGKVP